MISRVAEHEDQAPRVPNGAADMAAKEGGTLRRRRLDFLGYLLLTIAGFTACPPQARSSALSCENDDPTKLCCTQWMVDVHSPGSKNAGAIVQKTYSGILKDRDRSDSLYKSWCSHGDQSFCGKTFGPPKCFGTSSVKPKTPVFPSDPGAKNYGRTVVIENGVVGKALLMYPQKQQYASVSEISSRVIAVARRSGKSEPNDKLAERAWTAVVDARQGFYGIDKEYEFLRNEKPESVALADHYLQTYSIGVGGHAFDSLKALSIGFVADPVYNLAKLVLRTGKPGGFNFFANGPAPQSPANFNFWALAGAADAIRGRSDVDGDNEVRARPPN